MGNVFQMLPGVLGARSEEWGDNQEEEAPGAPSMGWSNVAGSEMASWPPSHLEEGCLDITGAHWERGDLPMCSGGRLPQESPAAHLGVSITHPRLSSQTAPMAWVFLALLGKLLACLMTKDFSPTGGPKSLKSPLVVWVKTSRSCHAA